jgi:hypothetical protein
LNCELEGGWVWAAKVNTAISSLVTLILGTFLG